MLRIILVRNIPIFRVNTNRDLETKQRNDKNSGETKFFQTNHKWFFGPQLSIVVLLWRSK